MVRTNSPKCFCHVSENGASSRCAPPSAEEAQSFKRMLLDAAPHSALAVHGKCKRGVNVTAEAKVTNEFVAMIIARTNGPPMSAVPYGCLADPFYNAKVAVTSSEAERLCCATMAQND